MIDQEFNLHRSVIQLLQFNGTRGLIYYHCPNGEHRSKRTGARLKAMGVRPGVADICLVLPGGTAAFLELKSAKGRTSTEQRVFRADCESVGAKYAVAASIEAAAEELSAWGALRTNPFRREHAA